MRFCKLTNASEYDVFILNVFAKRCAFANNHRECFWNLNVFSDKMRFGN